MASADGWRFYEREPNEAVTRHMLARVMDPSSQVHSIVAVDDSGDVVGIANYLTHESTTQLAPVCYLQDLFVDPKQRGAGIGAQLIESAAVFARCCGVRTRRSPDRALA